MSQHPQPDAISTLPIGGSTLRYSDAITSPPVLGLVGGIGSGKSHVAAHLAALGARVIAGDALGHEALRQADIKRRLVDHWGPDILDASGEIDRQRLARRVFTDADEKRHLESLSFPYIERQIRAALAQAGEEGVPLVVLDAAILLETGWGDACTAVVFVEAPEAVRLARVAARGWDAAELGRREAQQWPLERKRAACQAILDNSGSTPLEPQVRRLFDRYADHRLGRRGPSWPTHSRP